MKINEIQNYLINHNIQFHTTFQHDWIISFSNKWKSIIVLFIEDEGGGDFVGGWSTGWVDGGGTEDVDEEEDDRDFAEMAKKIKPFINLRQTTSDAYNNVRLNKFFSKGFSKGTVGSL